MSKPNKQGNKPNKNRNKFNNNNRSNGRGNRDKSQVDESRPSTHSSDVVNDYTYYIDASQPLGEQVNSYSFNQFAGVSFDIATNDLNQNVSFRAATSMQIRLNPSPGWVRPGYEGDAGINVAGLRTFTELTATNGKDPKYSQEDVSLLILSLGNLIAHLGHGARAFGLMEQYNYRNRTVPDNLMLVCGFDFQDLHDHFAEYRKRYNFMINKINQLPIPANIKYLHKCAEMYQGVYLDEEGSDMAQLYAFVPHTYWLFDEAYSPAGSGLRTMDLTGASTTSGFHEQTFGDYLTDCSNMLSAILTSSTFTNIYSDLLRLNQKQNWPLMKLAQVPDSYIVVPNKVEELSIWLNNATMFGSPVDATTLAAIGDTTSTPSNDVINDVNKLCVKYNPKFESYVAKLVRFTPIINFKHTAPSLEERVYATRLLMNCTVAQDPNTGYWYSVEVTLPDFYVTEINVSNGNPIKVAGVDHTYLQATDLQYASLSTALSKFDWHPYLYDFSSVGTMEGMLGDLQYFTTLDFQTLRSIHDTAILEEFRTV